MLRKFTVAVATIADGSATAYSPYFSGLIHSIQYVKVDYADGVDFAITVDGTGQGLWSESDVNAAATKFPRAPTHSVAGVAATYDGTRAVFDRVAVSRDRVKIVLAQGGNVKTGSFVITVDDCK